MARLTQDIPRKPQLSVGMVGGGQGAFSSDPKTGREAGEALGVATERVYATYSEMVEGEAKRNDRIGCTAQSEGGLELR
jgi:hypothetical protein